MPWSIILLAQNLREIREWFALLNALDQLLVLGLVTPQACIMDVDSIFKVNL